MSRLQWEYLDAQGHSCGVMVCTICRRDIDAGQYKVRARDDGSFSGHVHRSCCPDDPAWARLDETAERQQRWHAERITAYLNFVDLYGVPDDLVEADIDDLVAARQPTQKDAT